MGDLLDLFNRRNDIEREEVVKVWLGTQTDVDAESTQVRAIVHEMVAEAFSHQGEEERPVISVSLPAAPGPRRQLDRFLVPLGVDKKAADARVSPVQLVRYVEEHHGVPLMRVNESKEELWLGFRGRIDRVDTPLGTAEEVSAGLAGIEDYVDTVDLGERTDPTFAKASMQEALLYVLAAPFVNEQMLERRRRYGVVNKRGPQYLYLYGPSQNGKTTFLRFALKLITGELVDPFGAGWFTKPHIRGVQAIGTVFPLMFDDVNSLTSRTFEDITKTHWESSWNENSVFPQLIFTSNAIGLREWAKSRVKRVDFDVHFVQTTRNQERLAQILGSPNPLFGWFATLYLRRIRQGDWLRDDELATSRQVFEELYEHASRPLPAYFPRRPLEETYDPDLRVWKELVAHRKVRVQANADETIVTFADDLEPPEVRDFLGSLPQRIKHRRRGKTVIVESPEAFHQWLKGGTSPTRRWRRWFGRGSG